MKKRILIIVVLLVLFGFIKTKALTINDCNVLASFKLQSSLDEETHICKGKKYGNKKDNIYYSGKDNIIYLKNTTIYYLTNSDYSLELNISGNNNIALLHKNNGNLKITGTGSIKFKESSFVNKIENGNPVYNFIYNNKTIVNEDDTIFESTIENFELNYLNLKEKNSLPEEFNPEDYQTIQVEDHTKMTSQNITTKWIKKNIITSLNINVEDGYGLIKYVKKETKKKTTTKSKTTKLETDKVILISKDQVDSEYKLNVEDLKKEDIAFKIEQNLKNSNLLSFYDLSVYEGQKQIEMKNGQYTIKIKIDDLKKYDNYQIIYVNDEGKIEEYLQATIENDYVVFTTSHLSQYGVIGTNNKVDKELKINQHLLYIMKIVILITISLSFTTLITYTIIKSKKD